MRSDEDFVVSWGGRLEKKIRGVEVQRSIGRKEGN